MTDIQSSADALDQDLDDQYWEMQMKEKDKLPQHIKSYLLHHFSAHEVSYIEHLIMYYNNSLSSSPQYYQDYLMDLVNKNRDKFSNQLSQCIIDDTDYQDRLIKAYIMLGECIEDGSYIVLTD